MQQEIKRKHQIEIQKLSDGQLKNLLENKRQNMILEAIVIAYDEAARRGLYLDEKVEEFILNVNSKKSWHYMRGKESIGPFSAKEILLMYENNQINHMTKVWKVGFIEWKELHRTKLIFNVSKDTDNLLTTPPLVTSKKQVSNGVVWVIAFMPIIGFILSILFSLAGLEVLSIIFPWIVLIVLLVVDLVNIKKAGYESVELTYLAIFIKPVYMFKRAKMINENNGYAIVYLVFWSIKALGLLSAILVAIAGVY